MKNQTNFFIHIQSDTLAHYLVNGLFCPSQFFTNKKHDIQDNYGPNILLSDKKWNVDCDCSVEIELLENEISKLSQLQDNYFLIQSFFPLSRLRKIYFSDSKKAKIVIWNINNGAAFVPDWAISFESKSKRDSVLKALESNISINKIDSKLNVKMQKYNRLMGGLAFMRIGLLAKNNLNLDITVDYLSVLSYFNTYILNEVKDDIKINDNLQSILTGQNEIFNYLTKNVSETDIKQAGKSEGQNVKKKFNTIVFDNLNPNSLTFKLAVLNTYGKGKVKSDNDLVSGILSKKDSKIVEEISLIFGLYTGYRNLRNNYGNEIGTVDIKFKLNSVLEFYLIESLFNYTYHDQNKSGQVDISIPDLFSSDQKTYKNHFDYINILGESYAYKKLEKEKSNLSSLTSLILKTIRNWSKKNNVNYDENKVSRKIDSSIIPEIYEASHTKKPKKGGSQKNEKRKSKNNKNSLRLFPELEQNQIKENSDKVNNIYKSELNKKNVKELQLLCKEKGFKGYSKLKKDDLIEFIISQ